MKCWVFFWAISCVNLVRADEVTDDNEAMESQVSVQRTRFHRSGAEDYVRAYEPSSFFDGSKSQSRYPKKYSSSQEKENIYLNKNNLANRAREPRDEVPWESVTFGIDDTVGNANTNFLRETGFRAHQTPVKLQPSFKENKIRPPKKYQIEAQHHFTQNKPEHYSTSIGQSGRQATGYVQDSEAGNTHHQSLHSDGSTYLQQIDENVDDGKLLGFSSFVEHFPEGEDAEEMKTAMREGSLDDIKKLVPKSGMTFKIYHDDGDAQIQEQTEAVKPKTSISPFAQIDARPSEHTWSQAASAAKWSKFQSDNDDHLDKTLPNRIPLFTSTSPVKRLPDTKSETTKDSDIGFRLAPFQDKFSPLSTKQRPRIQHNKHERTRPKYEIPVTEETRVRPQIAHPPSVHESHNESGEQIHERPVSDFYKSSPPRDSHRDSATRESQGNHHNKHSDYRQEPLKKSPQYESEVDSREHHHRPSSHQRNVDAERPHSTRYPSHHDTEVGESQQHYHKHAEEHRPRNPSHQDYESGESRQPEHKHRFKFEKQPSKTAHHYDSESQQPSRGSHHRDSETKSSHEKYESKPMRPSHHYDSGTSQHNHETKPLRNSHQSSDTGPSHKPLRTSHGHDSDAGASEHKYESKPLRMSHGHDSEVGESQQKYKTQSMRDSTRHESLVGESTEHHAPVYENENGGWKGMGHGDVSSEAEVQRPGSYVETVVVHPSKSKPPESAKYYYDHFKATRHELVKPITPEQFDHKKALQESTSFSFGNAIDTNFKEHGSAEGSRSPIQFNDGKQSAPRPREPPSVGGPKHIQKLVQKYADSLIRNSGYRQEHDSEKQQSHRVTETQTFGYHFNPESVPRPAALTNPKHPKFEMETPIMTEEEFQQKFGHLPVIPNQKKQSHISFQRDVKLGEGKTEALSQYWAGQSEQNQKFYKNPIAAATNELEYFPNKKRVVGKVREALGQHYSKNISPESLSELLAQASKLEQKIPRDQGYIQLDKSQFNDAKLHLFKDFNGKLNDLYVKPPGSDADWNRPKKSPTRQKNIVFNTPQITTQTQHFGSGMFDIKLSPSFLAERGDREGSKENVSLVSSKGSTRDFSLRPTAHRPNPSKPPKATNRPRDQNIVLFGGNDANNQHFSVSASYQIDRMRKRAETSR